jgi:hypothetical protein
MTRRNGAEFWLVIVALVVALIGLLVVLARLTAIIWQRIDCAVPLEPLRQS